MITWKLPSLEVGDESEGLWGYFYGLVEESIGANVKHWMGEMRFGSTQ